MLLIQDVYPGSRIRFFPSRIRIISIPEPGSASKNLSILTQKLFLSSRKYDPGCSPSIRILIFFFPDTGSRGQKGTGSRIRIRNTALQTKIWYMLWFTGESLLSPWKPRGSVPYLIILEEASSSTPPSSRVPDFLGASSTLYLRTNKVVGTHRRNSVI